MTGQIPSVGLWRDAKHRYFAKYADGPPVGPIPGVTGTIGMIDKPAIAIWRGNTVAETIADNLPLFSEMIEKGGRDAAVKWAGSLPNYQRDKAADTGSLVHILVEKILRKREVEIPVDLVPYTVAFRRFLEERQPAMVSVEQMVANLNGPTSFGGTFDFIADFDGVRTLVDVKTWRKLPIAGRDMYAETAMQLAAYSRAAFIGAPGDVKRHRMPQIKAHKVLHLRPDIYASGYSLIPFEVTDADYEGFLGLLAAYRWKQERSKVVIGEVASMGKVV